MKQVEGFWLPDGEVDLVPFLESSPKFFKGPTYQVDKLLACLPWIKRFGLAVDIGAHCGLWSRVLVKMFKKVDAFEPVPAHVECFRKNVPGVILYPVALGDMPGSVPMQIDNCASGNSSVDRAGHFPTVDIRILDEFHLPKVDFIKIDCEGFEYFVVAGGVDVICSNKPCIIVEQKKGMGSKYGRGDTDAVLMLQKWGAKLRFEMSGDYCLSWD